MPLGKEIYVNSDELEQQIPGILTEYAKDTVEIFWMVGDEKIVATLEDKKIRFVAKKEHANKTLRLETATLDGNTYYNQNSPDYVIESVKILIDSGFSISGRPQFSGTTPLKTNITIYFSGTPYYHTNTDSDVKEAKKKVKLSCNGKEVGTKIVTNYSVTFKNLPLKYNAKNEIILTKILSTPYGDFAAKTTNSYYYTTQKLTKPSLRVTKISKKNAHLVWGKVAGATHYWVYKGSKKIKELKGKTAYTVKGKKAGASKYRVQAVIKSGGKVYKSAFSKLVKPAANVIKFNRSVNYTSTSYATCPFRITKISLSGKTYTVTGYAVNNRIFKMVKYKNLTAGLRVGGKKAFSKKYKNYKVNCKPSSSKKIVLKIKGRAGVDLRNGTITYTEGGTPVWK